MMYFFILEMSVFECANDTCIGSIVRFMAKPPMVKYKA